MRYGLFALAGIAVLAPLSAHAAFDFVQIVPDICDCPTSAPAYGCVLQVIQNIIRVVIALGFVLATIALMYAGFTWITSGSSAERRSQGKNMLINVFVGLAVILCAWLIVDFVMKTFYTEGDFGPWNNILGPSGDSAARCVVTSRTRALTGGEATFVPRTSGPGGFSGEGFTYQSGIEAQNAQASAALAQLLTCMASELPAGVGQISSISDSKVVSGQKTMQQCALEGNTGGGTCAHTKFSCHYGGHLCTGQSYAVDFGDQQNVAALTRAGRACGASDVYNEGNHIHVSVGRASGCGCDN